MSKETRVKVNGQRDVAYDSHEQKLCFATLDVTECNELFSFGAQMIDQLVEGSNNNHKWRLVLTVAKKIKQGNTTAIEPGSCGTNLKLISGYVVYLKGSKKHIMESKKEMKVNYSQYLDLLLDCGGT